MPRKKAVIEDAVVTAEEVASEEIGMSIVDKVTEDIADDDNGTVQEEQISDEVVVEEINEEDFLSDDEMEAEESSLQVETQDEAPDEGLLSRVLDRKKKDSDEKPKRARNAKPKVVEEDVLTLRPNDEAESEQDRIDEIWHLLKNSQVSRTPLTGTLGKIEKMGNSVVGVVIFHGVRVIIHISEMMIYLRRPDGESDEYFADRQARILNKLLGAEIDFIVHPKSKLNGPIKDRAVFGSRKAAMLRLRQRYYFGAKKIVEVGKVAEARIVGVSEMAVRVEVFGVETTIGSRLLSWSFAEDAREKYFVGDVITVRVTSISGDKPENLSIKADVRSTKEDDVLEKLKELKSGQATQGMVSDVRGGVIYINLIEGIRAIAHSSFDSLNRKPGRSDVVAFVVKQVDLEGRVAVGTVTRIIKRKI